MPKPFWKVLSRSPSPVTSHAPPDPSVPLEAPSLQPQTGFLDGSEYPCVSSDGTLTFSDSTAFPFHPIAEDCSVPCNVIYKNVPAPVNIAPSLTFPLPLNAAASPPSPDSYSLTSSASDLALPDNTSNGNTSNDNTSPFNSQSPVMSPSHNVSPLPSAPSSWSPCSCTFLDEKEGECLHPSTVEWSKLAPAVCLAILAGMTLLWTLATSTQKNAMVSAVTYTTMVLFLVLTPLLV